MTHHRRSKLKRRSSNTIHTTVRSSNTQLSSISVKVQDQRSIKKSENSTSFSTKNDKKEPINDALSVHPDHVSKINQPASSAKSKNIQLQESDVEELPDSKRTARRRKPGAKSGWAKCCRCSPLCTFLSISLGFLAVVGLIAALLAWLTQSGTAKTTETTTVVPITPGNTSTTASMIATSTTGSSNSTTTTMITTDSTTTITSIIISTTTTTTTAGMTFTIAIGTSDPMVGLWNTTAGRDGRQSSPGNCMGCYPVDETPTRGFDGNTSTKYLNFGSCPGSSTSNMVCGVNTGFHVTPAAGATVIRSVRLCTANDNSARDPFTMTLEGSNQTGSALFVGSSWTLIYNGSTGLTPDPGRATYGVAQTFSNWIAYTSYRILMTSKRGSSNSIQYSEIRLFA